MTTLYKSYLVEFKALLSDAGEDTGRFEAIVAAYGNVDKAGDRLMLGAFADSIGVWQKSGDNIPLIWTHDWANPFAHIGSIDPNTAVETEKGLKVVGEIDLTNAFAAQVHSLMKRRMVKEFSFGYLINPGGEKTASDGARELSSLQILEIGPCLKGINDQTELLNVKSELQAAASPGSALTELHDAVAALQAEVAELKAQAGPASGKADEVETPKADDPDADLKSELIRAAAALAASQ